MVVPIYLIFLRLFIPFSILKWPLPGILFSTLLDMYDWKFVNIESDSDMKFYQFWDKGMDIYYLTFALFVVLRFKDKLVRNITVFLFLYRLSGLILFSLTNNRELLFYFPNVFENFIIFYLIFILLSKRVILLTSGKLTLLLLTILIIPKLIHEYFQHFLGRHPWEIYNTGEWLNTQGVVQEYLNYLIWGGLFYIVPLATIGILILKRKIR